MPLRKKILLINLVVVILATVSSLVFWRAHPPSVTAAPTVSKPAAVLLPKLTEALLDSPTKDGVEDVRGPRLLAALRTARVLDERQLPARWDGSYISQKVIEWHGKFSVLRIDDEHTASGEIKSSQVAVADHLLVRLREGATAEQLVQWLDTKGFKSPQPIIGTRSYIVSLPSGSLRDFDAAMESLNVASAPAVYAEPDLLRFASSVPNDTSFPLQWALQNLGQTGGVSGADSGAVAAWDTTKGIPTVVVAIIDSGIDLTHPDLAANLWVNTGETAGNYRDDDNNGYADDVNGWNFYSNSRFINDGQGHGTHCAGVVGAVANNNQGVSGIAPNVRIMPLQAMSNDGYISIADSVAALAYAARMHANITSHSYGGSGLSATERDAYNSAQSSGLVCVVAAGNESSNNDHTPSYPASFINANIISVAASSEKDLRPRFSNWGPVSVDIAAPGLGILSTYPGGQYKYESGTSMACPLVAGACALVKSAHPNYSSAEIKSAILNGADQVPGFKGLVKSNGRLNVARAIKYGASDYIDLVKTDVKDGKLLGASGNGDGVCNAGETVTIAATIKNAGPVVALGVTTQMSVRQDHTDVTVLRDTRTWGNVAPAVTLANATASALPFLIRIAPDAVTQTVTLVFTHRNTSGTTWFSETPLMIAGTQTVSGKVTFVTGGKPIKSATVNYYGPISGKVVTAADGTYSIKLPDGSYTLTASFPGYETTAGTVISVPPAAANVNFAIGRSAIVVNPVSVSVSQIEQAVTTKPITITNKGDRPLTVSVADSSSGSAVNSAFYNLPSYGSTHQAQAVLPPIPWVDGFESGVSSLVPSRYHREWTTEDDYYIYYWISDYYVGSSAVVTNTAAVGQRSLYYADLLEAGFDNGLQHRFPDGTQPKYISFWVRPGSASGTTGCFSLEDGSYDPTEKTWNWVPIVQISGSEGGRIDANGMLTGGDHSVQFTPKAWHHIELRNMDWTARTFDYWVNGALVKQAIPFQGYSTQAVRVHVYNESAEGESWWDEMRVLDHDLSWLSYSPSSVTIAPGESGVVNVRVSAENMKPGTYSAALNLRTNDPLRPVVNIPVAMGVTPHPNSAPVAISETVTINEDTVSAIPLHFTDKENDPVWFTITSLPKVGILRYSATDVPIGALPATILASPGAVYYDPPLNAHGEKVASFTFQAHDYRSNSNYATISINITHVNDVPVANDDLMIIQYTSTQGSIDVIANDTDRDVDPLSVVSFTQGAKGTVTAGTGTLLTYKPNANFNAGTDTFTYTISDTANATASASVLVVRASSTSLTLVEDTAGAITLSNTSATTGGMTTQVISLPAKGHLFQTSDGVHPGDAITSVPTLVTHPSGTVYFQPDPDGNGSPYASFNFSVTDAKGHTAKADATITVTNVPDAPRATDDRFFVSSDVLTALTVLSNDVEPDGETMTIKSFTQPAHGTVTRNSQGGLSYLSAAAAGGTEESFSYTVSDPGGLTSTANVFIAIKGTSSETWLAPGADSARSGSVATTLGAAALERKWTKSFPFKTAPVTVSLDKVFVSQYSSYTSGSSAFIALDKANGGELWRHNPVYWDGVYQATYFGGFVYYPYYSNQSGSNGSRMRCVNPSTGAVLWDQPGGSYPLAVDEKAVYVSSSYGVRAHDAFTGAPLYTSSGSYFTSGYGLTLAGSNVLGMYYTTLGALAASTGTSQWSFQIPTGYFYNSATGMIATGGGIACVNINGGSSAPVQATCVDLTSHAVRWRAGSGVSGTPAISGANVYTLEGGTVKAYTISTGALVRTYTATGETAFTSDQPVVTADSVVVCSATSTYVFDLSTGTLRQTIPVGGAVCAASRSLFITAPNSTVQRYGPPASVANTAPVANAATLTINEDTAVTVTLTATDADALKYIIDSLPTQGTLYQTSDGISRGSAILIPGALVSNAGGQVIYVSALDANGAGIGSFGFHASDGDLASATAQVTINVTAVNDPPLAYPDVLTLRSGEGLTNFRPQANDFDVDRDVLTVDSTTQPAHGTVVISSGGGIDYTPSTDFTSGVDSFSYTIKDPSGATASATVTIRVANESEVSWPTLGGGPEHTGFKPVQLGSGQLAMQWATGFGSSTVGITSGAGRGYAAVPSTSNGRSNTKLTAFDLTTGAALWSAPYAGAYQGDLPTWVNHRLYLKTASSDGALYSVSDSDGKVYWSQPIPSYNSSFLAPVADDVNVYASGGYGRNTYGFNVSTGAPLFVQSMSTNDDSWAPTLSQGRLFTYIEGKVREHDPATGVYRWIKDLGWANQSYTYALRRVMTVVGDMGYLINYSTGSTVSQFDELVCLDLNTQNVKWSVSLGTSLLSGRTPAVANGIVYAVATSSSIAAFDAATGRSLGTFVAPSGSLGAYQPIVTADLLIARSSYSSQSYVFDLSSRALRQTLPVGGEMSVAGRNLFVVDLNSSYGTIFCYRCQDAFHSPPVATAQTVTTNEDTDVAISLSGTDPGGAALAYVISELPATGQLYQTSDGITRGAAITAVPVGVTDTGNRVIYAPPLNGNGLALASFYFRVTNGEIASTAAKVTCNVTSVNDVPVAHDDYRQVRAGEIFSPLMELANDLDVEGDVLTVKSFTQPAVGLVAKNSDGTLRYEAAEGISSGTYSFNYTMADTFGATSSATVFITYAAAPPSMWSTFGNGPDHTGYSPVTLSRQPLAQRWVNTSPTNLQVAVADGKVFASVLKNSIPSVVALDEKTGLELWAKALRSTSSSYGNTINSPSYYNGRIYVQHSYQSEAELACLTAADGTKVWGALSGNQWSTYMAPAVNSLGVYANAGTYGGMSAFKLDGTKLFSGVLTGDNWTPGIYKGAVYGFSPPKFASVDPVSGTENWNIGFTTDYGSMYRTIAFGSDCAFIVASVGTYYSYTINLVCIDLITHTTRWMIPGASGAYRGTPAVADNIVYAMNGNNLEARLISDGTLVYSTRFAAGVYSVPHAAPVVTNDLVFVPSAYSVYVVGRYDGVLLQTITVGGEIAVAGDQLLISTGSGVYAYGPPPLLTFSPPSGTYASAQTVTLTAADSAATIYYTVDGTSPKLSSASVASGGNVRMDHTGSIRAIAVKGSAVSRIVESAYAITSPAPAPQLAMKRAAVIAPANALLDSDHDGQTDTAEALAGTNPSDAQDVFRICGCAPNADGNTMTVSWPSKTGRSYRVQCSTDMKTWIDVSPSVVGTDGVVSQDVARPLGTACFLRVRLE